PKHAVVESSPASSKPCHFHFRESVIRFSILVLPRRRALSPPHWRADGSNRDGRSWNRAAESGARHGARCGARLRRELPHLGGDEVADLLGRVFAGAEAADPTAREQAGDRLLARRRRL